MSHLQLQLKTYKMLTVSLENANPKVKIPKIAVSSWMNSVLVQRKISVPNSKLITKSWGNTSKQRLPLECLMIIARLIVRHNYLTPIKKSYKNARNRLANWPIFMPLTTSLSKVEFGMTPGSKNSPSIMKHPSLGPFMIGRLSEPT